jgi:hypothetical protein
MITFREALLAQKGLSEQNKYHHDLLQLSTRLIILSGFNAKAAVSAMNKVWPIGGKKSKSQISEAARANLRRLKEAEAFASAKEKINGGRSQAKG